MARDATHTRARLLRAGEHRFARDGVQGARLRDIVRDAGSSNDSAIGYHFGSREGLLTAIVATHMETMELARSEPAPGTGVVGLVRLVAEPTAELLRTEEGRDFLRIMEQLAGHSGLESGRPAAVLAGTVLGRQLAAIEAELRAQLGTTYARERVAALATFLTAALAERARAVEAGGRQRLGHERYVAHLSAMLAGAVTAP